MPPSKHTASVVEITNPSTTFYRIIFEVHNVDTFDFAPGQFVALRVDENKVNDYSIASLPNGNRFELIIDIKPGHEGSYFVHDLQAGDQVNFLGPVGSFVYHPDDGAEQIVLLATGSGIAPLKSIAEQLLFRNQDTRPIHLYFGLRTCSDIFLHEYFQDIMARFPNFSFSPCLSRPDMFWRGECGHITDLLKQDYPDGSKLAGYMCGNKLMIEETKAILEKIGTPKERIYSEAF